MTKKVLNVYKVHGMVITCLLQHRPFLVSIAGRMGSPIRIAARDSCDSLRASSSQNAILYMLLSVAFSFLNKDASLHVLLLDGSPEASVILYC